MVSRFFGTFIAPKISEALFNVCKYLNFILLRNIAILSILSIFFMLTASVASEYRINASTFMFAKKHIIFVCCGLCTMILCSILHFRNLRLLILCVFTAMLLALIALPFFGLTIKGSSRWLNFGFFALQPSELLKPSFFFVNGILLTKTRISFNIRISVSIVMFAIISSLILMQPDFGMFATFLFGWLVQIFLLGIGLEFIFVSSAVFVVAVVIAYFKLEYIHKRVDIFFSGAKSYQTAKAIFAIQNGGIFGSGFGSGYFKYQLPDCHTDYIFSVIFEEFGLIAILLILYLYAQIFKVIINFIKKQDLTSIVVSYGLMSTLFFQIFVNISVNLNLMPSKGMTFPLISYGGSSTIASYMIFGIILNLTSRDKKKFNTYYDSLK